MRTKKNKMNLTIFLTIVFIIISIFSFLNFNNKGTLNLVTKDIITQNSNNDNISPKTSTDHNQIKSNFNDQNINNADQTPTSQNQPNTNTPTDQNTINDPKNENSRISDTSTCIIIDEIWNDYNKSFNGAELTKLMRCVSNTNVTFRDLSGVKSKTINANTMRSYNSNKDIIVTLGGLQWTVTYLSQDNNSNPILTLWLADSSQLAGKPVYKSSSPTSIPVLSTFDSNGNSIWNSGFAPNNSNSTYPDYMYGSCYMRAVTLNNGGFYTTSTGGGSSITLNKTNLTGSVFSPFTITTTNKSAIADYLVAPINVSWQYRQSARAQMSWAYDTPNEGWGRNRATSEFSGGDHNYTIRDKYDAWNADLLWLPSTTELGVIYNTAQEISSYSTIGYWYLSSNQMKGATSIWVRSGPNNFYGNGYLKRYYGNIDRDAVNKEYGVCPALHLNLNTASESVKDIWLYDKFDSKNLNTALKYLTGENTTKTNSELSTLINNQIGSKELKANQIEINASKIIDKKFLNANNNFVITFGGLCWYAVFLTKDNSTPNQNIILTLWLADSEQLYNKGKAGTDGSVKYNVYGSSSWNSGSPPYKDTEQNLGMGQFSNNYGNSNIRNLFSTASITTNTASVFYPYLKTSTNKTAMGDFIVAPKDLNLQDTLYLQKTQSAKSTLGFRYNLPNESYANLDKLSPKYSINNVMLSNSEASLSMPIMLPATGTADTQTTLIINEKVASTNSALLNYTAWQNDKLWLPSLSEVGLGINNTISTNSTVSNNLRTGGLWGLSTAQRSNTNKTATWLRSGHITDKNLAYTISSDGLDYGYETVDTQNAIRPALHLNLTLACKYST